MGLDMILFFQPESRNLTYAEMDADEKNRISHRFKALDKIKEFLAHKGRYGLPYNEIYSPLLIKW